MHSNLEIAVPYAQTHLQSGIRNQMKALPVAQKKSLLENNLLFVFCCENIQNIIYIAEFKLV